MLLSGNGARFVRADRYLRGQSLAYLRPSSVAVMGPVSQPRTRSWGRRRAWRPPQGRVNAGPVGHVSDKSRSPHRGTCARRWWQPWKRREERAGRGEEFSPNTIVEHCSGASGEKYEKAVERGVGRAVSEISPLRYHACDTVAV